MGKYFVGHDRKRTMLVLPDITLLQASFSDIRIKGKKIQRKKDLKKCSIKSRGMFQKIPGEFEKIRWNVRKGSGERSRRFRGIFKKIPGNFENKSEE